MGTVYQEQVRYNTALSCYRNALAINPYNAVAHLNLGICQMGVGKSLEAADSYRRALDINPDYSKACAYLVGQLQQECAWQELKHWSQKLDDLTKRSIDRKEQPAETPFLNITRHADPAINYAVAKLWCGNVTRPVSNFQRRFDFTGRFTRDRKITIGYLSNNFRNHPAAQLVHDLFGLHNRNRFNVFCYSYGKNDGSPFGVKIRRNSDRFVELHNLSHIKSAEKIFGDKVDILVDLAGHTEGNRMEICSLRPAPLQVRYLGMPGTTGADYFDYIITDPIVIPEEHAPFYSEKFVYLPHCYQMNSTRPGFSDYGFTRKNLGLPENDFVFCSFNTSYKLDPVMFDVWMSILKRVSGSVLWLLKGKETVERNLRLEAEIRDVDPNRLVFADKLPKSEHLVRLRYADLALDTRIVNGAITTSDTLWSGVPVLAVQGSHFASRMSSSILSAVGLQEMVANSLEQYESLAVGLADNAGKLKRLKEKLENNRKTETLFDTSQFVKYLEKAYAEMLKIFLAGGKPRQIKVPN
jgi:protein O-GlcNAc transferase